MCSNIPFFERLLITHQRERFWVDDKSWNPLRAHFRIDWIKNKIFILPFLYFYYLLRAAGDEKGSDAADESPQEGDEEEG